MPSKRPLLGGTDHKYKIFNKHNSFVQIPCHYPAWASGAAVEKRDSANLSISLTLDNSRPLCINIVKHLNFA